MARSKLKRAEAEEWLQEPSRRVEALGRLPDDVDPELAANVVLSLIKPEAPSSWFFADTCKHLPASVIRAVLARLRSGPRRADFIFLTEAVSEGPELVEQWQSALKGLLDLQTSYAWGSKQRRAKLKALAENPRFLAALQTAVVGGEHVLDDMLAALAADGSEASVDALLPRFVAAQKDRSELLDQLAKVKTHAARTPAMDEMLSSLREGLDERNAASPALAFARELGLEVKRFKVYVRLHSTATNAQGAPIVQCAVTVDSTSPVWLSVHLVQLEADKRTSFTSERSQGDELELGRCEARELPAWIERASAKFGVTWAPETPGTKHETLFAQWVRRG